MSHASSSPSRGLKIRQDLKALPEKKEIELPMTEIMDKAMQSMPDMEGVSDNEKKEMMENMLKGCPKTQSGAMSFLKKKMRSLPTNQIIELQEYMRMNHGKQHSSIMDQAAASILKSRDAAAEKARRDRLYRKVREGDEEDSTKLDLLRSVIDMMYGAS